MNLIDAGNLMMLVERGLGPDQAKKIAEQWRTKCDAVERLSAALAKIRKEDERESHPCGPQEYGYLGNIAHAALTETAAITAGKLGTS